MRTILYPLFALLIASTLLPSCNRKLKKEMEDLEKEISDLKSKNATLETNLSNAQNSISNLNIGLEADNPLTWTFSGPYDATDSFSGAFACNYLMGAKYDDQFIWNSSGNIWEVYVSKSEDLDWDQYAEFDIYFNIVSGVITSYDIYAYHYDPNYGDIYAYADSSVPEGNVSATTLDIDTETGEVNIELNWSNYAYSFGYGTESGKMKFTGICYNYN